MVSHLCAFAAVRRHGESQLVIFGRHLSLPVYFCIAKTARRQELGPPRGGAGARCVTARFLPAHKCSTDGRETLQAVPGGRGHA